MFIFSFDGLSKINGIVTYNGRRRQFRGSPISKFLVFGVHPYPLIFPKMTSHNDVWVFEHEAFPKITLAGRVSDACYPVLNLSIVELFADCVYDIKTLGSSICDGNKDAIVVWVDCGIRLIGAEKAIIGCVCA